jgi:hypothetical protein
LRPSFTPWTPHAVRHWRDATRGLGICRLDCNFQSSFCKSVLSIDIPWRWLSTSPLRRRGDGLPKGSYRYQFYKNMGFFIIFIFILTHSVRRWAICRQPNHHTTMVSNGFTYRQKTVGKQSFSPVPSYTHSAFQSGRGRLPAVGCRLSAAGVGCPATAHLDLIMNWYF